MAQGQSAAWRKTTDGLPARKKRRRTASCALADDDIDQGSPGRGQEHDDDIEADDGAYAEIDEEAPRADGDSSGADIREYNVNNTSDNDSSGDDDVSRSSIEGDQSEHDGDADAVDVASDNDNEYRGNYNGNDSIDDESNSDGCNDDLLQPPSATDEASTGAYVDKSEGRKRRLPAALSDFVFGNPAKKKRAV